MRRPRPGAALSMSVVGETENGLPVAQRVLAIDQAALGFRGDGTQIEDDVVMLVSAVHDNLHSKIAAHCSD